MVSEKFCNFASAYEQTIVSSCSLRHRGGMGNDVRFHQTTIDGRTNSGTDLCVALHDSLYAIVGLCGGVALAKETHLQALFFYLER